MSRLLIALAVFAAGLGAGWTANGWRLGEQIAQTERDHIAVTAAQNEAHRLKERAWTAQTEKARNDATQREIKLRNAAAGSRGAAERLRNELASVRRQLPGLAADACRVRADTLAELFGQCAGEYQSLAERADRHANDVQTLIEAWPE